MQQLPQSVEEGAPAFNGTRPGTRSPLAFFLLVVALCIPFWLVGLTGMQLLPGLPVSALWIACPLIAAVILVHRESGTAGVIALLRRSFDYRRIRAIWYAPILLVMPVTTALMYLLLRLTGSPLPAPEFPLLAAMVMFLAFFVAALGEEVGWSGYAIDPMQERWNALSASVLLGVVAAACHVVPFVQVHRSAEWIAWQSLFLVATRVILVWLYNNTGKSVFAVTVYHAILNLSAFLFPGYYDPRLAGLIIASSAAIVAVVWGPRTLARFRFRQAVPDLGRSVPSVERG